MDTTPRHCILFAVCIAAHGECAPARTTGQTAATTHAASATIAPEVVRLDLDRDAARQVVVDKEPGVYLGHVSTVNLDDGTTILAAYPKGHGQGPIILKRSTDGGKTWSDHLPVPESWATSKETPTLFRVGKTDRVGGRGESLILFSGLYPIRAARSADGGATWTDLAPIGDFGGIVAMGGLADLGEGRFAAFFHDDGRFIAPPSLGGKATGVFTLYHTDTTDRGATWSAPRAIWSGSEIHLCEPGVVASPDGRTLALLLRENKRVRNAHVMFSTDKAATWSPPRELPASLTGDRHIAAYARDGRLVVTFRCMVKGDPWAGDWVAWVGTWDEIARLAPGAPAAKDSAASPSKDAAPAAPHSYLVRLKDNLTAWDCGYAGLESLADGTLVATTYGTWNAGEKPSILCVRFTLAELDALATGPGEVIRLTGEHRTRLVLRDLKPGAVVDAAGAKFHLALADKARDNNYPLQVRSSRDTLVRNVDIIGDIPLDNPWNVQYEDNNSAAFSFISSHGGTLEDARIVRSWDPLRAARDSDGRYVFRRVYASVWRDDVIETDSGYPDVLLEDCLFDGGFSGFSCRQGAGAQAADASARWLRSRKILMRLAPFPGNEEKYGNTRMHSSFVKLHENCQSIEVTDNVWAFENTDSSAWGGNWSSTFKEKLKVSERNLLLWLGEGPFPESVWVPPGFTTLSGQAARDEWNRRRDEWLRRVRPKEPPGDRPPG